LRLLKSSRAVSRAGSVAEGVDRREGIMADEVVIEGGAAVGREGGEEEGGAKSMEIDGVFARTGLGVWV